MRSYVRSVWRHWLAVVGGVVMAAAGFVAAAASVTVPAWVFWALALIFLSLAQYRAYRDVQIRLAFFEQVAADALRLRTAYELTGEVVRVADLVEDPTRAVVSSKTFRECTLVGPAVMLWVNTSARHCSWEGDAEQVFYPRHEASERRGLVAFVNCRFERCQFLNLGAYGGDDLLEVLRTIPKV